SGAERRTTNASSASTRKKADIAKSRPTTLSGIRLPARPPTVTEDTHARWNVDCSAKIRRLDQPGATDDDVRAHASSVRANVLYARRPRPCTRWSGNESA